MAQLETSIKIKALADTEAVRRARADMLDLQKTADKPLGDNSAALRQSTQLLGQQVRASIGTITGDIANMGGAVDQLKAGNIPAAMGAVSASIGSVIQSFKLLSVAMLTNPFTVAIAGLGALVTALVSMHSAVDSAQSSMIAQAESLRDLGDASKLATADLQRYSALAAITGANTEAVVNNMADFKKLIEGGDGGSGQAATWLKKLEIDSIGAEDALVEVAGKMALLGSDAERTAAQMALFGTDSEELGLFLKKVAQLGPDAAAGVLSLVKAQSDSTVKTALQVEELGKLKERYESLKDQSKSNALAEATLESRREADLAAAAYASLGDATSLWQDLATKAINAWSGFTTKFTETQVKLRGEWRDLTQFFTGAFDAAVAAISQKLSELTAVFYRSMAVINEGLGRKDAASQYAGRAAAAKADADSMAKAYDEAGKRVVAAINRTNELELQAQYNAAKKSADALTKEGKRKAPEALLKDKDGKKDGGENKLLQAELALQRTLLEAEYQRLEAVIKAGDAVVDRAFEQGQISINTRLSAKLEALRTRSGAIAKQVQTEIEQIEAARKKLDQSTPDGQAKDKELQAQVVKLKAKLDVELVNAEEAQRKLAEDARKAFEALDAIKVRVRVEFSKISGQFDKEAVRQQIEAQFKDDRLKLTAQQNDPDTTAAQRDEIGLRLQQLEAIKNTTLAQAELANEYQKAGLIQSDLANKETQIETLRKQGKISDLEAEGRLREARQAAIPLLQQEIDLIGQRLEAEQALAALNGTDISQFTAEQQQKMEQLRNSMTGLGSTTQDLGTKFKVAFENQLGAALTGVITGTKSLKAAFGEMLQSVLQQIISSRIKDSLTNLFTPGGGGGGSGGLGGSILSSIGSFLGFAEGGYIGGPRAAPGKDNQLAMVAGGEYVLNQRATDGLMRRHGRGFLDHLNTHGKLPAFASGGLVELGKLQRTIRGYAAGGLVAASAGAGAGAAYGNNAAPAAVQQVPVISVQLVNNGTPQQVRDQNFDLAGQVLRIFLSDLKQGGPLSQNINNLTNTKRLAK